MQRDVASIAAGQHARVAQKDRLHNTTAMSSYFTLPSFARAKKNTEELEKTNPTKPVLNDADEEFLTKITSQDTAAPEAIQQEPPVQITEDGEEKELPQSEATTEAAKSPDQIALPETKPEELVASEDKQGDEKDAEASKEDSKDTAPDPPEVTPHDGSDDTKPKKTKKNKTFELPSQEEAEAATKGFDYDQAMKSQGTDKSQQDLEQREPPAEKDVKTETDSETQPTANKTTQAMDQARSWAQYASTYIPSTAAIPSIPSNWTFANKKDFHAEPVYKKDGTIDEAATKEKQEKEVSVLLDNLSLSSINNRVFSFSAESQKYYDRFTQVLKDTLNGAPTAYEDMDKLMRDAGPTLEKNFASMPPFVQTLVKSLPAKLGASLGPELMAAASEKPGHDMKARMAAGEKGGAASAEASGSKDGQQKKKRRIPGLKSLTSSNGVVASILRNIVNFLQVRFPFLVSTTNVVMSLAVFILMFVFWYCHKRGKQVRLDREIEEGKAGEAAADDKEEDEFDGSDFDATDSDGGDNVDNDDMAEQIATAVKEDRDNKEEEDEHAAALKRKEEVLNKP
ncbi:hypothetical protein Q7P36_010829 [Cladosporium allicinum]